MSDNGSKQIWSEPDRILFRLAGRTHGGHRGGRELGHRVLVHEQ
ncbi:MAG: hypothetical protein ABSH14_01620 [Verrucomicrobiia bacterium]|jgi:hypothetical protein